MCNASLTYRVAGSCVLGAIKLFSFENVFRFLLSSDSFPTPFVQLGHVDFVIKVYYPNVEPRFPEGGKMSTHLDSLKVCATVEFDIELVWTPRYTPPTQLTDMYRKASTRGDYGHRRYLYLCSWWSGVRVESEGH